MKIASALLGFLLLITACGYKSSSHVTRNIFAQTVYIEVAVDKSEPENAPYVKDEMHRLIYNRFKGKVVAKAEAQSQIHVSYAGSTFIPLAYTNGYITRYSANIRVIFKMLTKEGKLTKKISTIVESDIQQSSLVSSTLRTEAIGKGLQKALDEFLAYVSAKGMLKETK